MQGYDTVFGKAEYGITSHLPSCTSSICMKHEKGHVEVHQIVTHPEKAKLEKALKTGIPFSAAEGHGSNLVESRPGEILKKFVTNPKCADTTDDQHRIANAASCLLVVLLNHSNSSMRIDITQVFVWERAHHTQRTVVYLQPSSALPSRGVSSH